MQFFRTAALFVFCGAGIAFFTASGLGRLSPDRTAAPAAPERAEARAQVSERAVAPASVRSPEAALSTAGTPAPAAGQCADGVDNDDDGLSDTDDPDCYASADPTENACSDGSAYCEGWCAANRDTAVRCVGFDDADWLDTVARTWRPKHGRCTSGADPNECMTIDSSVGATADSAGALRLENPLDLTREMARSGSLPIQFNDDGVSNQFGAGSDFWVQYDMRVDQRWIDHLSPKQIYINEGDQADWRTCVKSWKAPVCAASCTDMEIVAQESSNLDYYDIYHGCPGPHGNKRFQYKDSTTEDGNPICGKGGYEFRRQIINGMCCSNDPSDCVYFHDGVWARYWTHVTIGPDWDAADDRVEVFIRLPGDTQRVRVIDSDISGPFGDKFRSRLRNCGYCSADPKKKCWTSDDCGGSGQCTDRHRCGGGNGTGSGEYGKIWINNRSALHGTPPPGTSAYAWYDNLIISRTDPGDSPVEPR